MKKFSVLIVDDERLARDEIRRHLETFPEVEVQGEAADIEEARRRVQELNPDLLFLDVQMPGGTGFDLLESLEQVPEIIFTTAYDQYAVKAFEINAIDYLVKPIRQERFARAMERVKSRLVTHPAEQPHPSNIFVREGERCYLIRLEEIQYMESSGNYARIFFSNKKVLIKRSLNQLIQQLPADTFVRLNRNVIIHTNYIEKIKPLADGRLQVYLKAGPDFTVSARQSAILKKGLFSN